MRRQACGGKALAVFRGASTDRPLRHKIRLKDEMPRQTDAKSLLRFNGTVKYSAKFLLRLSDLVVSPSSSVDAQERRVDFV